MWSYHRGMWSYHRGVWSYHRGVWSYHRGVWSYHRVVWSYHRGVWSYHRGVWSRDTFKIQNDKKSFQLNSINWWKCFTAKIIHSNSMQQSPSWEADSSLLIQEAPCILCKLKFHRHVHNRLPLVSILSQVNSIHSIRFCFFNKYFK